MPTGPVPYADLRELLRRERILEEDPGTAELIRRLQRVKRAGEFSRAQFLEMCRWKSARAIRHYRRVSAARVRAVSRAVLATRSERRRVELLTSLRGVGIPMASAVLTLIDPRRYGVLDIRVWQLLFAIRSVRQNPGGRGFTLEHWERYLRALREHARRLGVSVRAVEWTLFHHHRAVQAGRLYDPVAPPRPVRASAQAPRSPVARSGRPTQKR
jgi:hypothetical protein